MEKRAAFRTHFSAERPKLRELEALPASILNVYCHHQCRISTVEFPYRISSFSTPVSWTKRGRPDPRVTRKHGDW
jgi:hypothetical protein